MSTISDKVLLERFYNGDTLALETLIKRYQDKVYSTIFFFVKNHAIADDLFQEAFIKIIDTLKRGKYKEQGKFGPWAARIAYNLCIDRYRKNKRRPNTANADIGEMTTFLDVDESDSAVDTMVRDEDRKKVRMLIDTLPEEQKEVVILRHYAEMPFKQIAKLTGVSINTALGRMRYALNNMRKAAKEKGVKY